MALENDSQVRLSAGDVRSLLAEVQAAAVDDKQGIASLLRKCAVLAARLKNEDFQKWVTNELNGYPDGAGVPPYRDIAAQAYGNLLGVGWAQRTNVPIPSLLLPEKQRAFGEHVLLHQPIVALEELSQVKTADGTLQSPWPGNLILLVQQKFKNGWQLTSAWQEIPKSAITGVVDTVRNRILEFTLQLEQDVPTNPSANSPLLPAKVEYLYQTVIYGNMTGNVATGSPGAVQTNTVTKGDINALLAALKELGIPKKDAEEVVPILQQEADQPMGPKTSGWLAKISSRVAERSIKLAEGVTTATIVKLLMSYFGL